MVQESDVCMTDDSHVLGLNVLYILIAVKQLTIMIIPDRKIGVNSVASKGLCGLARQVSQLEHQTRVPHLTEP